MPVPSRGLAGGGSELRELAQEDSEGVGLCRRVDTTVRGEVATEAVSESSDSESSRSWRHGRRHC